MPQPLMAAVIIVKDALPLRSRDERRQSYEGLTGCVFGCLADVLQ